MRYGSFSVETSYQPSGPPFSAADAAGVGDQAVDQRDVRAVEAAFVDERPLGVLRDEDFAGEPGRGGVGRRGVAGVAGGRQRDRRRAEILRARDRRRLPARLERVGRVERFVLDVEAIEAERGAERARVEQRREPFAERDRLSRRRTAAAARGSATCSARVRRGCRATRRAPGRDRSGRAAERRRRRDDGAARIERRRPARHGAFEMGEEGHRLPAEQLRVLLLLQLVDRLDVLVGQLLDLVEALLLVVFRERRGPSASSSGGRSRRGAPGGRCCGRPRSACARACDSSLRRSSVSDGSGMRTTLPSFAGFRPRPAARMAFSIAPSCDGSNGCATISVGSGIDRPAT